MIGASQNPRLSVIRTTQDLRDCIDRALEELLPAMEVDGGGAVVISFESGVLRLRLTGTCEFCPSRRLSALALVSNVHRLVPAIENVIVEHATGTIALDSPELIPLQTGESKHGG